MFKYTFLVLMIIAFFIAACGSGDEVQLIPISVEEPPAPAESVQPLGLVDVTTSTGSLPQANVVAQEQRVILKDATLNLIVADAAQTADQIATMAEDMGGWVVSSNVSSSTNTAGDEVTSGTIVVRVPAERLTEFLDTLKADAIKVQSAEEHGQDVTAEFVDLESQLENLRASEDQLQTIMETARSVEDVLNVRAELERVRGEINVIEGRLRFFRESAAFSSVTVRLAPEEDESIFDDSWNPGDTAEDALAALVAGLQALVDIAIWSVICLLPIVVVGGVLAWVFYRRFLPFLAARTNRPPPA